MKKFSIISILLCLTMLISACGETGAGAGTTEETVAEPEATSEETTIEITEEETTLPETEETTTAGLVARDPDEAFKVLFIGNSYSYYNDLNKSDGIFANVARNAGYKKVSVRAIYKGGYYLRQFLSPTDTYGAQVLQALKSQTKYDIVIIQEQSANPINNPADFYTSCRQFKTLIDANGGEMWLYATWGYKTGHSNLSKYGPTTERMEMRLRAAYTAIAEELGVGVVYAGAAMTKAFTDKLGIELYNSDNTHPSAAGSYLVAWTMFGTIFGVDPATLTYNGTLKKSQADALRAVASEIVNNPPEVSATYKVKSAGIGK